MPPRKRLRTSQAASPSAGSHASTADTNKMTDEEALNDPWTDEEEIGLFKALIKWKPTGIHKHFRMLQLREYLLDNRYIHPRSEHTTIAGIWQKLATLYDLEALDQREDARQLSDVSDENEQSGSDEQDEDEDDAYSLAANKIHKESFSLPDDVYGNEMWAHRLAQKRDESPPFLPELNLSTEAPIEFVTSIEVAEDTVPTPKKSGRPSKAAAVDKQMSSKRRSRRGGGSVEAESTQVSEAGDADDDADEMMEEDDQKQEDDTAESSEDTSASKVRGARTRGRAAPRGRPRGRRK